MSKEIAKKNVDIALELAVKIKYDSVTYYENWKGLDVYVAEYKEGEDEDEDVKYIGYPFFIIVSNGTARFATFEDTLSIMGVNPFVDLNDSGEVL